MTKYSVKKRVVVLVIVVRLSLGTRQSSFVDGSDFLVLSIWNQVSMLATFKVSDCIFVYKSKIVFLAVAYLV